MKKISWQKTVRDSRSKKLRKYPKKIPDLWETFLKSLPKLCYKRIEEGLLKKTKREKDVAGERSRRQTKIIKKINGRNTPREGKEANHSIWE